MAASVKGPAVMGRGSLCPLLDIGLGLVHYALSAQGRGPLVVGPHVILVRQEHVLHPAHFLHHASCLLGGLALRCNHASSEAWADYVREDLPIAGLSYTWWRTCQDRAGWRAAIKCLL